MIEEYKNAILEKLDQDDYASAYELCDYLRIKLIDSVCFNDIEDFREILQYLNEIKNRANEKVKNPKKDKESAILALKMKETLIKIDEKELQKFLEKLIRTSYYMGAVSGFVKSLCDISCQFKEKSFVPHRTSIDDLLFLKSSSDSLTFMQALHGEGFIEHVDGTQTFIAELIERDLIKIDENETAFLTNKGTDLIKYNGKYPDIVKLSRYPIVGYPSNVPFPYEFKESDLTVEKAKNPLILFQPLEVI